LTTEIRFRANILPLKAMVYATAHARQKVCMGRNSNGALYVPRLTAQIRDLGNNINSLNSGARQQGPQLPDQQPEDENPDRHSKSIESAVRTYVDLFYSISKEERKGYIESFTTGKGRRTKISNERNLLVIPALMAELKQPKEEVSKGLFYSLYKMPFRVLYDSSKAALHVENFLNNMALKDLQYETVERFSKSMSRLETRMKAIEKGTISPAEDEHLKVDFIDKAIEFSKATDINVVDIIGQRVGTESAINAKLHGIRRKTRY
jgi:hypothetical protein